MTARSPREAVITTAILRALRAVPGTYAIKLHGSLYSTAGTPDLLVVHNGRAFLLEVKRPGQKPTPVQLSEMARWTGAGATSAVVYGVPDALALLLPPL